MLSPYTYLPRAHWFYCEKSWVPFQQKDSDQIEKGYYHFKKGGSPKVSLDYHQRKINLATMEESSQFIEKSKVIRGTWFWKEDDGSWITFTPEETEILEVAFKAGKFEHDQVVISKKPKRVVTRHENGNFKQYRQSPNAKAEGRDVLRGYMGHLCKCYENYPLPPQFQIFGVDFSEVMKHPTNANLKVPYIVDTAINMLSEKAGNTKYVFCEKEKLEKSKLGRVEELETLFNLGDLLNISSEDIDVIACLLQNYIYALPDPLCTQHLYKQWSNAYVEDDLSITHRNIKKLLEDLPFINFCIMKRLVSVFSIACSNSVVTDVDVEGLAEQWTYPIFKAILIDEYNMKQVLVNLITHYNQIFSDIVLQPKETTPQHIISQSSSPPNRPSLPPPMHTSLLPKVITRSEDT